MSTVLLVLLHRAQARAQANAPYTLTPPIMVRCQGNPLGRGTYVYSSKDIKTLYRLIYIIPLRERSARAALLFLSFPLAASDCTDGV